ncbi:MAG: serine/threonine protein phosphatase [Clostridia bacterium]|nr:serine/threonine protein phosphatase [Clostridia bacterium]
MKTLIIGDIHGCSGALERILDLCPLGENDRAVLLGDLFDRGSESWEVFRTVKALSGRMGERLTLLLGNHEDYLLSEQLSLMQRIVWERVGRGATVSSFKRHGGKMEDSVPWLKEHCRLYWQNERLQCVHAGLMVEPIEANDRQTLLHDHLVTEANRYAGKLTVTGHIAIGEPTWFIGDGKTAHVLPYEQWLNLLERGVICIDTGCGKGGRLTAMTVEGEKFRLTGTPEKQP